MVKDLRDTAPDYAEKYKRSRKIADAYPDSPGGRALIEMLVDVGEEKRLMQIEGFVAELNDWLLKKQPEPDVIPQG